MITISPKINYLFPLNNNYNQYSSNLFFNVPLKKDVFFKADPDKNSETELSKHKEVIDGISEKIFNPYSYYLYNEENMDQEIIADTIEELTGQKFQTVLSSEQTIKTLIHGSFNREVIDSELENISKKTLNKKVCMGFDFPRFVKSMENSIKERDDKMKPDITDYKNAQEDLKNFTKIYDKEVAERERKINDLERQRPVKKSKNKKESAKLRRSQQNSPPDDLEIEIARFESELEKYKEENEKIREAKENALYVARCKLDRAKGNFNNVKLPDKQETDETLLALGMAYENIAAKEVDRIIIPSIAEKIAIEEKANSQIIKRQLRQLRNVTFDTDDIEIDHLIIRIIPMPEEIEKKKKAFSNIEVVGIVETKYSPEKLYDGFKRRMENLKWLKKEGNLGSKYYYYDERTNTRYKFTAKSFENFSTDLNSDETYKNIYFVTSNKPFMNLDKEILNNMDNLSNIKFFKNSTDPLVKDLLQKYDDLELWDNIIFTNNDYCGYSLSSLLFNFKYRNIIKDMGINPFNYYEFN